MAFQLHQIPVHYTEQVHSIDYILATKEAGRASFWLLPRMGMELIGEFLTHRKDVKGIGQAARESGTWPLHPSSQQTSGNSGRCENPAKPWSRPFICDFPHILISLTFQFPEFILLSLHLLCLFHSDDYPNNRILLSTKKEMSYQTMKSHGGTVNAY